MKGNLNLPLSGFQFCFFSFILFFQTSLFPEKVVADKEKDSSGFKIEHFKVKDSGEDHYEMAITGNDEEEVCRILKGLDEKRNFKIKLSGIKTEIYKGSITEDRFPIFYFNAYKTVPPNPNAKLELFLTKNGKEQKVDETLVVIPSTFGPDNQPVITKVKPSGGVVGDTLVIQAKNLGKDIDKIDIWLHDSKLDEVLAEAANKDSSVKEEPTSYLKTYMEDPSMPSEYRTEVIKISPVTLSQPDPKTGIQELAFSIPEDMDRKANENFVKKSLKIRLNVNGRYSRHFSVTLLPENWNGKIILFTLFMTLCTIGVIAWILGKWNIMPNILLDVETNTYSLSRFQAFAWTVVLLGSYFYIAICTGLVLRDGIIPDFNPSLIGLMSISYTGLISSHFLGKKNPKNEIKNQAPELSNLFSTHGIVDISRLQLLCFTVIAIAVYLYNLIISNTLNGLPDIPPTLHGLLMTSQGSYLGGKIFGDKIAVNQIFPNVFSATETEIEFNIVGGGFIEGIKIMLEGSDKPPVAATYSSPSNISCKLQSDKTVGKRNLLLIPPVGTSISLNEVIEIVEGKNSDTEKMESEIKETQSKSKKKSKG